MAYSRHAHVAHVLNGSGKSNERAASEKVVAPRSVGISRKRRLRKLTNSALLALAYDVTEEASRRLMGHREARVGAA